MPVQLVTYQKVVLGGSIWVAESVERRVKDIGRGQVLSEIINTMLSGPQI
jgi:hypothetical protein